MYRLNEAKTIMKNELRAYFTSPVAYIVISVFLIITGFFFFKDFFYFNQAEMRNLFQFFPLIFTFVVPAVTMRLISEEKQSLPPAETLFFACFSFHSSSSQTTPSYSAPMAEARPVP